MQPRSAEKVAEIRAFDLPVMRLLTAIADWLFRVLIVVIRTIELIKRTNAIGQR